MMMETLQKRVHVLTRQAKEKIHAHSRKTDILPYLFAQRMQEYFPKFRHWHAAHVNVGTWDY